MQILSLQFKMTISTCCCNTSEVTNACVLSILRNSNVNISRLIVLDNGTTEKFVPCDKLKNVKCLEILDNTRQEILNFDKLIQEVGDHNPNSSYAGMKHTYSIQYLLDICDTEFMFLFDNDAVLKRSIEPIVPYNCISTFDIDKRFYTKVDNIWRYRRALPFIQGFNMKKFKESGIKYFDVPRIRHYNNEVSKFYDTGASFLEDLNTRHIPYICFDHNDYVRHLGGASNHHTPCKDFIQNTRKYWET